MSPPDEKLAAIRARLEKELAEAEASQDLERQIEVYRRFHSVFGGKEREIETRILEYDLRKQVAEGDQACHDKDYDRALGHYYKASAAAQKLGRAEALAEVEEKTRSARRLGNFQSYFNKGQEHERKGRLDEALQSYRGALTWVDKDKGDLQALVHLRIQETERRKRREASDSEAGRLWAEAVQALRKGQTDSAAAALEALLALKPGDKKVEEAVRFAREAADMVYVPAGEFTMGSKPGAPSAEKDESPERKVTLPAFFIDRFETRNKSYLAFVEATDEKRPEHWSQEKGLPFPPEHADHPIVNVSWDEASRYAKFAAKRLPTEEEWEKAARGTDGRTYPWGESSDGVRANVGARLSERLPIQTKPVGTSTDDVSPCGAQDMGGNASEWTASAYDAERKALRGGSWRYGMSYARCANRDAAKASDRFNELGFRCVKDIPDALEELR